MNELYADLNQARIFSTYDIFLGRKKQKSTRPDIVMRLAQLVYVYTYMYFASVFRYCEWVNKRLEWRYNACVVNDL